MYIRHYRAKMYYMYYSAVDIKNLVWCLSYFYQSVVRGIHRKTHSCMNHSVWSVIFRPTTSLPLPSTFPHPRFFGRIVKYNERGVIMRRCYPLFLLLTFKVTDVLHFNWFQHLKGKSIHSPRVWQIYCILSKGLMGECHQGGEVNFGKSSIPVCINLPTVSLLCPHNLDPIFISLSITIVDHQIFNLWYSIIILKYKLFSCWPMKRSSSLVPLIWAGYTWLQTR